MPGWFFRRKQKASAQEQEVTPTVRFPKIPDGFTFYVQEITSKSELYDVVVQIVGTDGKVVGEGGVYIQHGDVMHAVERAADFAKEDYINKVARLTAAASVESIYGTYNSNGEKIR